MAQEDTYIFVVGAGEEVPVWELAQATPVITPDKQIHSGLFEAMRYWAKEKPEDSKKKLVLAAGPRVGNG